MKQCQSCSAYFEATLPLCPECGGETARDVAVGECDVSSYMDFLHEQGNLREIFNLGVKSFLQGRYPEADAAYRKTLTLFPTNATVHGNLGHLSLRQGKIEEAIAWFEKAIDLNPVPSLIAPRALFSAENMAQVEQALERARAIQGIPEALEHARQLLERMRAVLRSEDIERLKTKTRRTSASIKLLEKGQKTLHTGMGTFVCTHERHKASSAADAVAFLESQDVSERFYYVEVDTPDGIIGKDAIGLYRL
jgi:hypothetical protein